MKKGIITAGAAMLLLTGCAGEVNLSEADNVRVAQYAADLLLQYDSNYKERLLTAEEVKAAEEKLKLAAEKEAALQALLDANKKAEAKDSQKEETGSSTGDGEGETEATQVATYNVNDVLKADGFEFSYVGYGVMESYPEMTEENPDLSMEVRAAAGKKLLVVKFNVENTTETKAECNLFEQNITGCTVVNGEVKADSMVTMLLNDLGTLKTEIDPGVPYESVLVFEIPEEVTTIEQLDVNIIISGESYKIEV